MEKIRTLIVDDEELFERWAVPGSHVDCPSTVLRKP
jgi:hypothetical protein